MTLFDHKAPWVMGLLMRDFGLSLDDAAAILGNLGHESGGFEKMQEIKPTVPGSRGGFGWAQWTGPRRRAFEAYCARNGFDPRSDKANYKYLWVELTGTERKAIPAVKAANGLRKKTVAFEKAFERAGVKHYDSRYKWAQRARNAYHEWSGSYPAWVEGAERPPIDEDPVQPDDPGVPNPPAKPPEGGFSVSAGVGLAVVIGIAGFIALKIAGVF